jgi:uncharacterized protein
MDGMVIEGPQLPVGTQVVLRVERRDAAGGTAQRGATGRVSGMTADGQYVVRLVDGREAAARRDQLSLRTAYQSEAIAVDQPDGEQLVREHTIYAAVVGSRAFGLDTDASDTDTRSVRNWWVRGGRSSPSSPARPTRAMC